MFDHVLAALVHGSGYERIATRGSQVDQPWRRGEAQPQQEMRGVRSRGLTEKLMDRSWLPHWADLAAMRTHPVLGRHFCG